MADNQNKVNEASRITIERINDRSIVAHVPGADLPFRLDDSGRAWVDVTALGQWLGYRRAADAKKLAKRLVSTGIINNSEVFATVAQTSELGGRPADVLWISREGALKLAARSDTTRAIALLDLIVRVFFKVVDDCSRRANDNADAITAAEVLELRNELAQLRSATNSNAYPWGSEARVGLLRSMAATLVKLLCRLDSRTTPAAERARVQMKMRSAIGYAPGRGHSLQMLTTDEFERAVRWLYSEIADAERRLPSPVEPVQLALVARKR